MPTEAEIQVGNLSDKCSDCPHVLARHRLNGQCVDCECVRERVPDEPAGPLPVADARDAASTADRLALVIGFCSIIMNGAKPPIETPNMPVIPPSRDVHMRVLAQAIMMLADELRAQRAEG